MTYRLRGVVGGRKFINTPKNPRQNPANSQLDPKSPPKHKLAHPNKVVFGGQMQANLVKDWSVREVV
jgi:hypothetical protein